LPQGNRALGLAARACRLTGRAISAPGTPGGRAIEQVPTLLLAQEIYSRAARARPLYRLLLIARLPSPSGDGAITPGPGRRTRPPIRPRVFRRVYAACKGKVGHDLVPQTPHGCFFLATFWGIERQHSPEPRARPIPGTAFRNTSATKSCPTGPAWRQVAQQSLSLVRAALRGKAPVLLALKDIRPRQSRPAEVRAVQEIRERHLHETLGSHLRRTFLDVTRPRDERAARRTRGSTASR